ncbi:MAG: gliding motility-associated C-terminal domain-containing protein [Bacteroidota bacterium]
MRKCLLFVALLIVSQLNNAKAQSLFYAPDTVCIRQQVNIIDHVPNASTYYWSFCSGNLRGTPVSTDLANALLLNNPSDIEIAKDGNNFFGFVLLNSTHELVRLSFGNSLANTPVYTNLGNPNGTIPKYPSSLSLIHDSAGYWYLFMTGGTALGNSALARADFGSTLANTPNIANFGDLGGVLKGPKGLFIAKDNGNWYGYAVNFPTNELVFISFGPNISITPTGVNLGLLGPGILTGPNDMAGIKDNGNWYLFVANVNSNSLARIDLGNSLANLPVGTNLGNIGGNLFSPSTIALTRDCGAIHAFVTDQSTNEYARVDMATAAGPYTSVNYGTNVGGFHTASGASTIIRDHYDLTGFVVNGATDSLVRLNFSLCDNSSIASSAAQLPPPYHYDSIGVYNIYFEVDAGLPTMRTDCKSVYVDSIHAMKFNPILGDTTICQGDTIHLIIQSYGATGYVWSPAYNISDTTAQDVRVWPGHSMNYNLTIPYTNGCIIDTFITVNVSQVKADAGPDRTILDGASTVIGSPNTSIGSQYLYTWYPEEYINNVFTANPTVNPNSDITYYLTVTELSDTLQCKAYDTVNVHVSCDRVNLPNAFAPGSGRAGADRFGLLNRSLVKLNYFHIYDRWGQEVFSTNDITAQWDGTVNGNDAQLGVYVWEVDGFCANGKRVTESGNVTLVR